MSSTCTHRRPAQFCILFILGVWLTACNSGIKEKVVTDESRMLKEDTPGTKQGITVVVIIAPEYVSVKKDTLFSRDSIQRVEFVSKRLLGNKNIRDIVLQTDVSMNYDNLIPFIKSLHSLKGKIYISSRKEEKGDNH
jgi:hypothetical protein